MFKSNKKDSAVNKHWLHGRLDQTRRTVQLISNGFMEVWIKLEGQHS